MKKKILMTLMVLLLFITIFIINVRAEGENIFTIGNENYELNFPTTITLVKENNNIDTFKSSLGNLYNSEKNNIILKNMNDYTKFTKTINDKKLTKEYNTKLIFEKVIDSKNKEIYKYDPTKKGKDMYQTEKSGEAYFSKNPEYQLEHPSEKIVKIQEIRNGNIPQELKKEDSYLYNEVKLKLLENPKSSIDNPSSMNILELEDRVELVKKAKEKGMESSEIISFLEKKPEILLKLNPDEIYYGSEYKNLKSEELKKLKEKKYNNLLLNSIINMDEDKIKNLNSEEFNKIKQIPGMQEFKQDENLKEFLFTSSITLSDKETQKILFEGPEAENNMKDYLEKNYNPDVNSFEEEEKNLKTLEESLKNLKGDDKKNLQNKINEAKKKLDSKKSVLKNYPELAAKVFLQKYSTEKDPEKNQKNSEFFLKALKEGDFVVDETNLQESYELITNTADKDLRTEISNKVSFWTSQEQMQREIIDKNIGAVLSDYEIIVTKGPCQNQNKTYCGELYDKCTPKSSKECEKLYKIYRTGETYIKDYKKANAEIMDATVKSFSKGLGLNEKDTNILSVACANGYDETCKNMAEKLGISKENMRKLRSGIYQGEGYQRLELNTWGKIFKALEVDQSAVGAYHVFFEKSPLFGATEEDLKWLDFEDKIISGICQAKSMPGFNEFTEDYEELTENKNGSKTYYGCMPDETRKQSVEQCSNILYDIRAESTKRTPDGSVELSYSYYLNAYGATNQTYDLEYIYKRKSGNTNTVHLNTEPIYFDDKISKVVRTFIQNITEDINENETYFRIKTNYGLDEKIKVLIMR